MGEHARGRRGGRRRPARHRLVRRRHRVLPLVAAFGGALLLGIGVSGTYASWSDTATITGASIASGSMDLQLDAGGGVGLGTGYTSNQSFTGLLPGDTRSFALTVKDVGQPSFRWTATAQQGTSWTFVSNPVTLQLYAGSVSGNGCSGTPLTATPVTVTTTATSVVTTPRTLAPGGTGDPVCVVVGLSATADNLNQSKSGSLRLDLRADQVVGP